MSGTLGKAWTHNLSLVAYPVIVFVVALVPAGLWNTAENARQGGLTQLQAEIEGYVAEGTIPTFSQLTPLLLQGERLLSVSHSDMSTTIVPMLTYILNPQFSSGMRRNTFDA